MRHLSKVGIAISIAYIGAAIALLMQGSRDETFSGVYWMTAAFPWSYSAALVLGSHGGGSIMIVIGISLNLAISYCWGSAWESWWRGIRRRASARL